MSSSPHGSSHSTSKNGRRVLTSPELSSHAATRGGHRSISPTQPPPRRFSGNQIARDAREISPFGVRAVPTRQSTDSRIMFPDMDNRRWDMFQDEERDGIDSSPANRPRALYESEGKASSGQANENLAELPETLGGVLYVVQRLLSSHELRLALDMIDYMLSVSNLANCQLTVTSSEFAQEMRPFLNEARLSSDGILLLEALIPRAPRTTLQPQKPASERPVRLRSSKLAKRETIQSNGDVDLFAFPSLGHAIPRPGGWSRPHTEPSFTSTQRRPYRRWIGGAMSSQHAEYHSEDSRTTEYANTQPMDMFGSQRAAGRDELRSEGILCSSWVTEDSTEANRLQNSDSCLSIGRPCVAISSEDFGCYDNL